MSRFSDAPLDNPERDELDVIPFVRRLIRLLLDWPGEDSLVLGMYGPWGYGKTTVLSFLESELEKASPSGRWAIAVRFNPWLYTTPEALLASFFGTVVSATRRLKWLPTEKERKAARSTTLPGRAWREWHTMPAAGRGPTLSLRRRELLFFPEPSQGELLQDRVSSHYWQT